MAAIWSALNMCLKPGMRGVPSVTIAAHDFLVAAGGLARQLRPVHAGDQRRAGVADAAMLIDQPPAEHLGLIELNVRCRRTLRQTGQQERRNRDAAFHGPPPFIGFAFFLETPTSLDTIPRLDKVSSHEWPITRASGGEGRTR